MKWTKLIAIFCCVVNLGIGVFVLVTTSYEIISGSTKYLRIPVPSVNTLREYMTHLLPIMVFIFMTTILSTWGISRRKKVGSAIVVVFLHIISVGLCGIYINLVLKLGETAAEGAIAMKNRTEALFRKHMKHHSYENSRWIPNWLDLIQKESSTCCGITSYEDWQDFWPSFEKRVPISCCRETQCKMSSLQNSFDWPDSPSTYIKGGEGCYTAINRLVKDKIRGLLRKLFVLSTSLGLALVIILCQYLIEFCQAANNEHMDAEKSVANLTIGETWKRMGFTESGRRIRTPPTSDEKTETEDHMYPVVGSYTDFFLRHLERNTSLGTVGMATDSASIGSTGAVSIQNSSASTSAVPPVDSPPDGNRNTNAFLLQVELQKQPPYAGRFSWRRKYRNKL